MSLTKLAVLVSGRGSILEAIVDDGVAVSLVLADRPCRGLEIAAAAGIPTLLLTRRSYGATFDRQAYSQEVVAALQTHGIDLVAMAGFMTILAEPVFTQYDGRIINTHPSLLPLFRGEHAVKDTLAAGATESGCTIHIATLALDDGPILAQATVPVLRDDTVASLHERIKQVERQVYPRTIRALMTKRGEQ